MNLEKITQFHQFLVQGGKAPDSPSVPHSLAGEGSPACPRGGRWPPPQVAPCAWPEHCPASLPLSQQRSATKYCFMALVLCYTAGKFDYYLCCCVSFLNRRFGSLFLLPRVPIGSLFHKKLGPYFSARRSLKVLTSVQCHR